MKTNWFKKYNTFSSQSKCGFYGHPKSKIAKPPKKYELSTPKPIENNNYDGVIKIRGLPDYIRTARLFPRKARNTMKSLKRMQM